MDDRLLERAADVDFADPGSGMTALLEAIVEGDHDEVERLVDRGARTDLPLAYDPLQSSVLGRGVTAFIAAERIAHEEMVDALNEAQRTVGVFADVPAIRRAACDAEPTVAGVLDALRRAYATSGTVRGLAILDDPTLRAMVGAELDVSSRMTSAARAARIFTLVARAQPAPPRYTLDRALAVGRWVLVGMRGPDGWDGADVLSALGLGDAFVALAEDGTYVAEIEGVLRESGAWSLVDGVLSLDGEGITVRFDDRLAELRVQVIRRDPEIIADLLLARPAPVATTVRG